MFSTSYSAEESNKILAKSFINFLGGHRKVTSHMKTNEEIVKFLDTNNFFAVSGAGSLSSLDEDEINRLGASFVAGVKYNNFNEFFDYLALANPAYAVAENAVGKEYQERYNRLVANTVRAGNAASGHPEIGVQDWQQFSGISRNVMLDSFNPYVASSGVMAEALRKRHLIKSKDAVSLFVATNKLVGFYNQTDKFVNHYCNVVQGSLFKDEYKVVETLTKPEQKPASETKNDSDYSQYEHLSKIFEGVEPEKVDKKAKKEKPKKEHKETVSKKAPKMKKTGNKIVRPEMLNDLKEMGVDTNRLVKLLTENSVLKLYLVSKNKALFDDIQDVASVDEKVRNIILEPVFKTFLGINNDYNTFDRTALTPEQIALFCNLANVDKNDFDSTLNVTGIYSRVMQNFLDTSLLSVESKEDQVKLRSSFINLAIEKGYLTCANKDDFLQKIALLVFEPEIQKVLAKNVSYKSLTFGPNKSNANKANIDGFVRIDGNMYRICNIPVVVDGADKNNEKTRTLSVNFTEDELAEFSAMIKSKFGHTVVNFDPKKDLILGRAEVYSSIFDVVAEVESKKESKQFDESKTKIFLEREDEEKKEKVRKNPIIINNDISSEAEKNKLDYSVFKSADFYKNAKDKAYEDFMKQAIKEEEEDMKKAEEDNEKAQEQVSVNSPEKESGTSSEQDSKTSTEQESEDPRQNIENIKEKVNNEMRAKGFKKATEEDSKEENPEDEDEEIKTEPVTAKPVETETKKPVESIDNPAITSEVIEPKGDVIQTVNVSDEVKPVEEVKSVEEKEKNSTVEQPVPKKGILSSQKTGDMDDDFLRGEEYRIQQHNKTNNKSQFSDPAVAKKYVPTSEFEDISLEEEDPPATRVEKFKKEISDIINSSAMTKDKKEKQLYQLNRAGNEDELWKYVCENSQKLDCGEKNLCERYRAVFVTKQKNYDEEPQQM
jgi:hypothetical protein